MFSKFGSKLTGGQGRAPFIALLGETSKLNNVAVPKAPRISASCINHPLPFLSYNPQMGLPLYVKIDSAKAEEDDHNLALIQGLGKPVHDFNPAWARDSVAEAVAAMNNNPQDKFDSALQGVHNGMVRNDQGSHDTSNSTSQDLSSMDSYQHSSFVSLYSVMQSNVPHPYSRSPTHLNMPFGGEASQHKYISGMMIDTHPSRNFSTSARRPENFAMNIQHQFHNEETPAAQGVQGFECDRYKLWAENCHRYRFGSCDEQLQSVQTGRKTLSEIFQEQDMLIEQIADDYKTRIQAKNMAVAYVPEHDESDMQGLQGTPKRRPQLLDDERLDNIQGTQHIEGNSTQVDSHLLYENPCPQGIQGNDCENFKLWLQNCITYGFTNCSNQLQSVQSGRKSLQQIFDEQDALISEIAEQYSQGKAPSTTEEVSKSRTVNYPYLHTCDPISGVRAFSTSSSLWVSQSPGSQGNNNTDSGQVQNLNQRQKLKQAVRDYGATVVVFHVAISLMSLGGFYLAVSSGLDVVAVLHKLGIGESILQSKLATGASTFVIAYAVHKVFAPVRIAMTLTCTPFIVRHLRRIGVLKPPKTKVN